MQYKWLCKENNKKLIVFFAGWSFDAKPFEYLKSNDCDVLMLYDYNNIELPIQIPNYQESYLLAWSMGVFVAYLLKDKLPNFNKKIAINGTVLPVNDEFGIPIKPFLLTLKHAKIGLEKKFYENIFEKREEFERYEKTPVKRDIDNRVSELNNLYKLIKSQNIQYSQYFDKAIISNNDKIIPTKNQINFWQQNTEYKIVESGHFPYYNFENWNELICL